MRASKYIAVSQALALMALVACDQRETPSTTNPPPNNTNPRATDTRTPDADNTGRNRRDTDTANPTPTDQNENQTDIRITADIRKAILADDAMSTNAENCKIITANGVVTLRGPVDSQAEKDSIETKAKAVAGVVRVDNQLEVKTR